MIRLSQSLFVARAMEVGVISNGLDEHLITRYRLKIPKGKINWKLK
jgi:hypothetical protein